MSVTRRKLLSLAIASGAILTLSRVARALIIWSGPIRDTNIQFVPALSVLSEKSFAKVHRLPPAQECLVCRKDIQLIGGQRMVAQTLRGTTVSEEFVVGGYQNFRQCARLLEDRDLYLITWGEPDIFSNEALDRARNEYLSGKHPWFCQKCGKRQCSLCGEPIGRPLASTYILDDGRTFYAALSGYNPGCINSGCKNYRYWSQNSSQAGEGSV